MSGGNLAQLMENRKNAERIVERVLDEAAKLGATSAEASLSGSVGISASVRMREVESVEHHRDKGLGVTVYVGQQKGSSTTNDFSKEAISTTVAVAYRIALQTGADEYAGLAGAEFLAKEIPALDLDHPWDLDAEQAIAIATRCEASALAKDSRISNSEGATVSTQRAMRCYGNTEGFIGGWNNTRSSISCAVVAARNGEMQRDHSYTLACHPENLDAAETVGTQAAERALARLGARRMATCSVPVLFEARTARSLFSHFIGGISGSSLYRKASFLLESKGKQVFPESLRIREEPHLPRGLGSAPFDNDGVATRPRNIVEDGILQSYVLNAYSARKLGMMTTGNAGGVRNLMIDSKNTLPLAGLLRKMQRGLMVTELIGFGVNGVTGDYSRGASGFWIEGGEVQYPVQEITIAGNLREMFMHIAGLGDDVDTQNNIRTGSVLIDAMTIAGV